MGEGSAVKGCQCIFIAFLLLLFIYFGSERAVLKVRDTSSLVNKT